eukprot:CCRYP_013433-RA/>CCRYP_013433-RA protein AED:0.92 eAED:0.45 QI:0/-1/0/1/-1/1/1/0/131
MVFFKQKYLTNSSISPADALIAAAANLAHVIQHNAKAQHIGVTKMQDLQRLQQLSSDTAKQHLDIPTSPQQAIIRAPPPRVLIVRAPLPRVPIPTPLPMIPIVSDEDDSDDENVPPPRVPTNHASQLAPHP